MTGVINTCVFGRFAALTALAVSMGWMSAAVAQQIKVDALVCVANDVSASVEEEEYKIQKDGTARAFLLPALHNAVKEGPNKRVAVTYVEWSTDPYLVIDWTILQDAETSTDFGKAILSASRSPVGNTGVRDALQFCADLIRTSPFTADRRVIDISSDGMSSVGGLPQPIRDEALAEGMIINALLQSGGSQTLPNWYRRQVVGGPKSFIIEIEEPSVYGQAMLRKLTRELIGEAGPDYIFIPANGG